MVDRLAVWGCSMELRHVHPSGSVAVALVAMGNEAF